MCVHPHGDCTDCASLRAEVARLTAGRDDRTMALIAAELRKAAAKFPLWPEDTIHAAAIVGEECGELQRAALQLAYEGGTIEAVEKEAIPTVAMAIQFLLNLPLGHHAKSDQVEKRALQHHGASERSMHATGETPATLREGVCRRAKE